MSHKPLIPDKERYAKHAALESIVVYQRRAYQAARKADAEYEWLCQLYQERVDQIERGEWPSAGDTR